MSLASCSAPTAEEEAAASRNGIMYSIGDVKMADPVLVGQGSVGAQLGVKIYKVADVDANTAGTIGSPEKDTVVLRYDVTNIGADAIDVSELQWQNAYWIDTPGAGAEYNVGEDSVHEQLGYRTLPVTAFPEGDEWMLAPGSTASWYIDWNPLPNDPRVLIETISLGTDTAEVTTKVDEPIPTVDPDAEEVPSEEGFTGDLEDFLNR